MAKSFDFSSQIHRPERCHSKGYFPPVRFNEDYLDEWGLGCRNTFDVIDVKRLNF
jgi:hypothetical protein